MLLITILASLLITLIGNNCSKMENYYNLHSHAAACAIYQSTGKHCKQSTIKDNAGLLSNVTSILDRQ